MNKICCWILAVLGLIAIMVAGLVVLLVIVLTRGAGETTAVKPDSYLSVEITGYLEDYQVRPDWDFLTRRSSPCLAEAMRALERAKDDDRIRGLILKPEGTSGFAGLRELRESVRRFKMSGKPVYAYLELATDRDYYLASIADTIVLVPSHSGGLVMLGVGVASTYLGRTFEKVGIKFNVMHAGDFKGAYENLARDRMSDSLRLGLEVLIDNVFETYVLETCADRPEIDPDVIRNDLLHGTDYLISGDEAVDKGYADLVLDWQGLRDHLVGSRAAAIVDAERYARLTVRKDAAKEIAVVFAQGAIDYVPDPTDPLGTAHAIHADELVEQLRDLREDEGVAAVVLRVNSPGGSSLASELILQEVSRLKTVKPVVVSMGNVAASGGYYISCAANYVIAQPNTVTGSIGVVSVIPTGEELFRKIAARVEVVEKGKWNNFFRFDRSLTADQELVLQDLMNSIYGDFIGHVAAGRKLTEDEVKAVASGRVWTGSQALERHLVDELGGLDLAIAKATDLAGLSAEEVRLHYYPDQEPLLRFIADRIGLAVDVMKPSVWSTAEDKLVSRAIEYYKGFMSRREFVQLLAPIDPEF